MAKPRENLARTVVVPTSNQQIEICKRAETWFRVHRVRQSRPLQHGVLDAFGREGLPTWSNFCSAAKHHVIASRCALEQFASLLL